MKQFLAAMAMLFVSVLAIWVGFRLAPETWAMIAGVVFGLLASLPMGAVVVILLRRARPPAPAAPIYYYPAAPGFQVIDAAPAGYGLAPPDPRHGAVLPSPGAGRPVAPRRFVDRAAGIRATAGYGAAADPAAARDSGFLAEGETAPWDRDGGDPAAWERQPAPRPPRILG